MTWAWVLLGFSIGLLAAWGLRVNASRRQPALLRMQIQQFQHRIYELRGELGPLRDRAESARSERITVRREIVYAASHADRLRRELKFRNDDGELRAKLARIESELGALRAHLANLDTVATADAQRIRALSKLETRLANRRARAVATYEVLRIRKRSEQADRSAIDVDVELTGKARRGGAWAATLDVGSKVAGVIGTVVAIVAVVIGR